MSQPGSRGVTTPVPAGIFTAAVAVLMLVSCGKAPADVAPVLSSMPPALTSSPLRVTTDAAAGASVPATPHPSEAVTEAEPSVSTTPVSSEEAGTTADASVTPSLYIPQVTFHPIATPSPTLSIPSVSPLAIPDSGSILGTWVNGSESLTFLRDYTYEYLMVTDGEVVWDVFGTYSHNRVTGKYVMDLMGNRWVLTIDGDTLTADNGHHISNFLRQQ